MRDITNDLQESDTQRIQLTIAINFISTKDAEKHSKSDSIQFISYNDTNEVVDELFDSLRIRYQGILETSMEGSEFIFDSVQMMYCKCHKVNFRRCGSYIVSPGCIKKKKATINPKNKDAKCSQYGITAALNYEEIKRNPEKV